MIRALQACCLQLIFVGVSDSRKKLQKLIVVGHSYSNRWRLMANVSKNAVMVFRKKGSGCRESADCLECVVIVTKVLTFHVMELGMCM